MENKIEAIKAQKAYVLEQAKMTREGYDNENAVKQWEAMAIAYDIALQILEESGQWMPEEAVEAYIAEVAQGVEGETVEGLVELIRIADDKMRDLPTWDYAEQHLASLRIEAYREAAEKKGANLV
jgi:hypothetical protein